MKYVQKSLGESIEASSGRGNSHIELGKLLFLALLLITVTYFSVNYITSSLIENLSIENEKKWLNNISFQQLDSQVDSQDPKLLRAREILQQLIQVSEVPELDYNLLLLKDEQPNAFAFPGGTIGITTGLLDKISENNSLAFVIGHELGHFKHRHHLKGISKAVTTSIIFSVLFGNQSELELTQQVFTLLDRRHSQQQEMDADDFGAKLVFERYGNTENIDQFFKLLNEKTQSHFNLDFFINSPKL